MTDAPTRVPPLPRQEWSDAAREVFAFWGEPNSWEEGSKTNTSMVFANHPKLAMAFYGFGKHLLVDSSLPLRPRELVVLRVAWHVKSEYEWHYHVGYAVNIGITVEEVAAIRVGPGAPTWSEIDRVVLQAVDELVETSRLSDETWAIVTRHFDRHAAMDLIFTVGMYVMLSWSISALGIQLEEGVDRIGFDLKATSGRRLVARNRPGETEDWASNTGGRD